MHTLIGSITLLDSLELIPTCCTFSIPPNFLNFCMNFQYLVHGSHIVFCGGFCGPLGKRGGFLPRELVHFILYIC